MKAGLFSDMQENALPLANKVAEKIEQLIKDGELVCGEQIPSEKELQEQLNVGRSVVREAIKLLVAKNVLEIRRGTGTFVAATPGMVEDPFGFTYEQDRVKLGRDLVKVRAQIEPFSAYLAAQNATDEDIKDLKETLGALCKAFISGEDSISLDMELHARIAECSKNLVLIKLIPVILYGIKEVNPQIFNYYGVEKTTQLACEEHIALIEAIESHDCEGAEAAMKRQLKQISAAVNQEQ